jgi:hypothetical protein
VCALKGEARTFKRKDHLLQHTRNCHIKGDEQQWLFDDFSYTQGMSHHIFGPDESLARCASPLQMPVFEDKYLPEDHFTDDESSLCTATCCSRCSVKDGEAGGSYDAPELAELDKALTGIFGRGSHDVCAAKRRLGLCREHTTTAKIAGTLRQLLLQPAASAFPKGDDMDMWWCLQLYEAMGSNREGPWAVQQIGLNARTEAHRLKLLATAFNKIPLIISLWRLEIVNYIIAAQTNTWASGKAIIRLWIGHLLRPIHVTFNGWCFGMFCGEGVERTIFRFTFSFVYSARQYGNVDSLVLFCYSNRL